MRKTLFSLLLLLLASASLMAGGYQVRLQGTRQTGMGLTGTALKSGASDIFYNPGSLGFLGKKFELNLGGNAIISKISFRDLESDYSAQTDNPVSPPFFFYGAGKLTDKLVMGLGVYTPYGSKTVWPDDWKGRYLIQNIGLRAYYMQPTISYQLTDRLGLGAGFIYMYGKADIQKALPYNDANVNLSGSTTAMGFNLGVFFKASDKINLGLNYRSKIEVSLTDGDATFNIPTSLSAILPQNNKFSANLPMPANLDFGVSFQATDKLLLSLELDWVMWGVYDTLTFTFAEKGELLNSKNPRLYSDAYIPRFGLEYTANEKLTLRAGAYYDKTPTNKDYFNPETVSLNTMAFTLGFTYKPSDNFKVDFSFAQLFGQEMERAYTPAHFAGKYKSSATIPGLGITYSF